MRTLRCRLAMLCIMLPLLAGCMMPKKTQVPIPTVSYRAEEGRKQINLLVLLPGRGENNTVYSRQGIVDEIRKRRLPFDVIVPDAHMGYYNEQTLVERLKHDIVDPARRDGYRQIWLGGFSLGGLGSLFYLRAYPGDVDGLLLASPFLGSRKVLNEIRSAGGVAGWNGEADGSEAWQRDLWRWIKAYDFKNAPPVWLGYGSEDRTTGEGPVLFASMLPAGNSFPVPGGHRMPIFKTIFLRHFDRLAGQMDAGKER